MKRARQKNANISEKEMTIENFSGLNSFGPHSDLESDESRTLKNLDVYGDYVITRRGSQVLFNDIAEDLNILSSCVIDTGDKQYVIIQQQNGITSDFRFAPLESGGYWITVKNKSDLTEAFTLNTITKVDMSVSNGKIYLFSTSGNAIIEWDESEAMFVKRKMGLPALQITSITQAASDGELIGKRVYGVELVYKDTSVTPNVDIIVSGPNRAILTASPLFKEGRLAYAESPDGEAQEFTVYVSPTLNDGSDIEATENDIWTHARLYKSKDLTTATTGAVSEDGDSEIVGREDELFQVQEMTREDFLATLDGGYYHFNTDDILDDDIPFPLDPVVGERLDLYPMPNASVGTYHRNRIWCSGVTTFASPAGGIQLESIKSKIFYTSEADTQYSESVSAINFIESDPGDGQEMMALLSFQEDLIGIKQGKTGRIINGDPLSGWITEDHSIGISNRDYAQVVPNIGICAIVNDQKDFRVFGFDLQWHSDIYGLQISRPIRDTIKSFSSEDLDFFYANGKLFISAGSGYVVVLAIEQKRGWTTYQYPFNSEVMFTYNEGRDVCVLAQGQPAISVEVEDLTTDYDLTTGKDYLITWELTTYRFKDNGGRSLIEQRYVSIVAQLTYPITCTVYVNGKLWDVPFIMLLDPQAYPEASLRETEYQGYSEEKPIGNMIHYKITGFDYAIISSIMLNALVQTGNIPLTFDPFGIIPVGTAVIPGWANPAITGIEETGVADDVIIETGEADDTIIE